jgi:hypothetical protein
LHAEKRLFHYNKNNGVRYTALAFQQAYEVLACKEKERDFKN